MTWEKVDALLSAERTAESASSFIRVRSEAGTAQAGAPWVAARLEEMGFRVESYSIEGFEGGPLIVGEYVFTPEGRGLMFDGHYDTDPVANRSSWTVDPFGGEIRDGYVHGRGAVDSKGGAAAMLAACEALVRSKTPLRGRILFASLSDGELAMRGADLMVDAGYAERTDAIISAEATECRRVEVAYPSITLWKIGVEGRAAHLTQPEHGINAVAKMATIVRAIEAGELHFQYQPWRWMEPRVTVNAIRSKPRGFEVPDNCDLVVNVLGVPGMTPATIQADIEAFLVRMRERDPEIRARAKTIPRGFYVWRRAGEAREDDPIVTALVEATGAVTGKRAEIAPFLGGYIPGAVISTVADRNAPFPKPPCVVFGPGDFTLAHSADERVSVEQLHQAARIYARAAQQFLK